jgi:betaine-homocysteine S-methyltransferase
VRIAYYSFVLTLGGKTKVEVQAEFKKQLKVFEETGMEFLLCEYFEHIEEMEWAIDVCLTMEKTVVARMCIGPEWDMKGCPWSSAPSGWPRPGTHVVGVNYHFDPFVSLTAMKKMKEGLDKAGLKPYLMCQHLAYHTPDTSKQGFIHLPEFPFALEPRVLTRWEMQKFARQPMGVRYIGGCSWFQPSISGPGQRS